MTKKEQLMEFIQYCIDNHKGLALVVENKEMPKPETIVNPHENLQYKKAYIDKAYNDDLELKTTNIIKIIGFYE